MNEHRFGRFVQGVIKWTIILVLCSFLFSGVLGAH